LTLTVLPTAVYQPAVGSAAAHQDKAIEFPRKSFTSDLDVLNPTQRSLSQISCAALLPLARWHAKKS